MSELMTKADRDAMAKLVRLRERVAKSAAKERSAELLADFERNISAVFSYDDDVTWKALAEAAQKAVRDADAQVAARCRELGIPEAFRPGLTVGWYGRGESATRQRRDELRRVAKAEIEVSERRAVSAIERRSAEIQTRLLAGGLQSDEAREFLESLPRVEELMAPLALPDLGPGGVTIEHAGGGVG